MSVYLQARAHDKNIITVAAAAAAKDNESWCIP